MSSHVPFVKETVSVGGISTSVLIDDYPDRLMVAITQLPTFGTIFEISAIPHPLRRQAEIRPLFGDDDDDIISLIAQNLFNSVDHSFTKPIVLSLGIHRSVRNLHTVKEIQSILQKYKPFTHQTPIPDLDDLSFQD